MKSKMKKTYNLIALFLVAVVSLSACSFEKNSTPKSDNICILYTNDMHAEMENEDGVTFAELAGLKAMRENQYKYVSLVDCGDAYQGTYIANTTRGAAVVDVMNDVGFDVATIGNHDFDYGMDALLANAKAADYEYVATNFNTINIEKGSTNASDKLAKKVVKQVKPYTIKKYGKTKVAFIGVVTPESLFKSVRANFINEDGCIIYDLCEDSNSTRLVPANCQVLANKVQESVDAARADGADYVVVLSHLGNVSSSIPFTAIDLSLMTEGIDVILDGHSHQTIENETFVNMNGETVIHSSTGSGMNAVGQLIIDTDGNISTKLIDGSDSDLLKAKLQKEAKKVAAKVSDLEANYPVRLDDVICKSTQSYSIEDESGKRQIRKAPNAMGFLVAEAFRNEGGAEIGFVNGGGVKGNINAGDVTLADLMNIFPYSNKVVTAELTGEQIMQALEYSNSKQPEEFNGYLQWSGLVYELDSKNKVINVKVKNATDDTWEEIDLEKTYTVASSDYLLTGLGDGYDMFANINIIRETGVQDYQAVANYLNSLEQ